MCQQLNLDIILFPKQKELKIFFDYSVPKELQVMAVNSCDVKAVAHNQYFFMD